MKTTCTFDEHDWRVDPRVILPTAPARVRLVCASCGAVSSGGGAGHYPLVSNNPKDWRKASSTATEGTDDA